MWTFTTNRFKSINVLVSGWSVIPKYPEPMDLEVPFPPLKGVKGKCNALLKVSKI